MAMSFIRGVGMAQLWWPCNIHIYSHNDDEEAA